MRRRFILLFISILQHNFAEPQMSDNLSNFGEEADENNDQQQRIILDKVIKDANPCECLNNGCSCSFNFFADNPNNIDSGMWSMKYDADNGLSMTLRIGEAENHIEVKDLLSGVDLPPLCTRVPRVPILRFCAVVYDVRLNQDLGLHLCSSIESQALKTTISSILFDCVNLSPNNINTIEPDQQRPSFVALHLGKSPKITFFNSVAIGSIPLGIPPLIEEDSAGTFKSGEMS